jgi:hypothetical protein
MKALAAAVVGVFAVVLVALVACHREPKHAVPAVYELPEGFTGWVTVEYAAPEAAALPEDHGARRIRVPAAGKLRTSSPQELGIVDNRFYFVDGAGRRTPIAEPEAAHGAAPDEASKRHDHPVVLGFATGDAADATGHRVFERFYIGVGPAGEPGPP